MFSSKSSCDHSAPGGFSILTIFYVWCILSQSRGTLASRYVYLRVPSSVQQPFATLGKYVFLSTCSFRLCHLYPTPSRSSYILNRFDFFRSSYSSGGDFFCVLSYPVRYQLICLLSFFSDAWFFSLSPWPQNLYISRMKNQEGRWGYCWCCW